LTPLYPVIYDLAIFAACANPTTKAIEEFGIELPACATNTLMRRSILVFLLIFAGLRLASASADSPGPDALANPGLSTLDFEQSPFPAFEQSSLPDGSDGTSSDQSYPPLDRRDRIFYPGDTERPKPLFRKLLLNIAYDQKDIFLSPFHANRGNALEW